eukprot:591022-Prymnesium_polylepis.1
MGALPLCQGGTPGHAPRSRGAHEAAAGLPLSSGPCSLLGAGARVEGRATPSPPRTRRALHPPRSRPSHAVRRRRCLDGGEGAQARHGNSESRRPCVCVTRLTWGRCDHAAENDAIRSVVKALSFVYGPVDGGDNE